MALWLSLSACQAPYDPNYDYRSVLAGSPAWSDAADSAFGSFTYQAASHESLRALDQKFGLSAIAGTGSSFERMTRTMAWINEVTIQNGAAPMPSPRTADNYISQSRDHGVELKCRAMAMAYAELLLALGVTARPLYLLPAQSSDDCHVIVMAWCPELTKWVYLDPDYNAWLAGPDGLPLGPLEIRHALQSGQALTISAGAGWNGEPFDLDYLHYLSKNFYQFASPLDYSSGWEEGFGRVMVYLSPQGVIAPSTLFPASRVTTSARTFFGAPAGY